MEERIVIEWRGKRYESMVHRAVVHGGLCTIAKKGHLPIDLPVKEIGICDMSGKRGEKKMILVDGGERYAVNVKNVTCSKRGCDLYDKRMCDGESKRMPCDRLFSAIQGLGFVVENGPAFRKLGR